MRPFRSRTWSDQSGSPTQPSIGEGLRDPQLLHEAAQQLSAALDEKAVLDEGSLIATQLLWPPGTIARRAHVTVLDGDQMVVAAETDDLGIEMKGYRFPLSAHSLLDHALDQGLDQGHAIVREAKPEVFATNDLRRAAARLKCRWIACVPLYRGDDVLGAISAFDREGVGFSDWQLQQLEATAALVDLAIGKADRLQTSQREAEQKRGELEAIKSQFLRTVSHEFRGPLGTLRAYTSMLREGALEEDRVAKAYELLDVKARQVTMLVNNMLDAARLEDGQLQLIQQPLDLRGTLARAYAKVRLATPASHYLQLREPEEPVTIEGDELKLTSLIHNLLDNAIKYSPSGGTIRCHLEVAAETALVEVSDHGLGIASEDMSSLFTRFGRIVNDKTANIPGAGLGLYLCRELARMHGGEISASSQLGRGSSFRLRLPLLRDSCLRSGEENDTAAHCRGPHVGGGGVSDASGKAGRPGGCWDRR